MAASSFPSVLVVLLLTGSMVFTSVQAADDLPPEPVVVDDTSRHGTAVEVLQAGRYTYLRLDDEAGTWIAGPSALIAVGDEVQSTRGNQMRNFSSPSLGRVFEEIWFVASLESLSAAGRDVGALLAPIEGGVTVVQVHEEMAELAGQQVTLRAQVTKVNVGILGGNWFHVRDGSGSATDRTDDLLVVTSDMDQLAAVGAVIVIRGTVLLDNNLGGAYQFPLMVADASIEEEAAGSNVEVPDPENEAPVGIECK